MFLCNYYLCTNCLHTYLIKYGQKKCPQCRRDGLIKFINIYKNKNLKFKCIQIILVKILYSLTLYIKGYFIFYILFKKETSKFLYIFISFMPEIIISIIIMFIGFLFPVTCNNLLNMITS